MLPNIRDTGRHVHLQLSKTLQEGKEVYPEKGTHWLLSGGLAMDASSLESYTSRHLGALVHLLD